jgi:hypothetical protein
MSVENSEIEILKMKDGDFIQAFRVIGSSKIALNIQMVYEDFFDLEITEYRDFQIWYNECSIMTRSQTISRVLSLFEEGWEILVYRRGDFN